MAAYRQSAELVDRIDWDAIMPLPRCSGGHDEQMRALFKNTTVIAHYNDGDWQGMVATCVRCDDTGEIVIYNDFYGSCSGCDAWECASDGEVVKLCEDLAKGAYIFDNLESCVEFLRHPPDPETSFDWSWRGTWLGLLEEIAKVGVGNGQH